MTALPTDTVIASTQRWLERAVIGLNLCPFAKAEHVHGRIRYVVSAADNAAALLRDLAHEAKHLMAQDPLHTETTLLLAPQMLHDFLDFNDFLDQADALLEDLSLDGILQVASFHPHYQFAGTHADDMDNYSNRAPYPTLHLLREVSVERAVAAFPEAEMIYERNIATLRQLGHAGWAKMMA
jgi:uncharacterized protein